MESVDGFTRFRNKATGEYLNIEGLAAHVQSTPVQAHWNSKDWTLEPVDGYFRLRSRWAEHPDYVHVENLLGYAQHAPRGYDERHRARPSTSGPARNGPSPQLLRNNRQWIPHPKTNPTAWAIVDTPRMVPASWGYNYPGH